MSKRKKNYPDPGLIVQNYGADALRSELCLNECECVFLQHECLCAGGRILFFNLPYVISRHGFKRFESLSTLNWATSESYIQYKHTHTYCTSHAYTIVSHHTFAPSP